MSGRDRSLRDPEESRCPSFTTKPKKKEPVEEEAVTRIEEENYYQAAKRRTLFIRDSKLRGFGRTNPLWSSSLRTHTIVTG
jgi:hypothetical protein